MKFHYLEQMGIKVRLFDNKKSFKIKLNEDSQSIAAQIAQLQTMQLDIEKKATQQIQNIEKQKTQKIEVIKQKIIQLQSQLTQNAVATTTDVSQQNTQQSPQTTGTSANQ